MKLLPAMILSVLSGCGTSRHHSEDGGTDTDDGGTDTGTQSEGCEPGSLSWAVGIGGDEYLDGDVWFTAEEVSNVVAVPDGAVVVAGTFMNQAVFDPGGPNETVLSAADFRDKEMFFARYEADGSLAWAKQAGGPESFDWAEWVVALDSFPDGTLVAAGYFQIHAVFGPGEPNETVLEPQTEGALGGKFHARFSSDGSLEWAKNLPSNANCSPASIGNPCLISASADGSYSLSGIFRSPVVFGEGEASETTLVATPFPDDSGASDLFLARFHGDGSLVWAVAAGGASGEAVHDIAADGAGGVYVLGQAMEEIVFDRGGPNEAALAVDPEFAGMGQGLAFLARYGADGSLAWATPILNACCGNPGAGRLELSADGSPVLLCQVNWGMFGQARLGADGPDEIVVEGAGQFIARFDNEGAPVQVDKLTDLPASGEGLQKNCAIDFSLDPGGSFVVTGSLGEEAVFGQGQPNETVLVPASTGDGHSDAFVALYDFSGALEWAVRAGGEGIIDGGMGGYRDWGSGVTFLTDGSVAAIGRFFGTAVFGPEEPNETWLTAEGLYDGFLVRLCDDGQSPR